MLRNYSTNVKISHIMPKLGTNIINTEDLHTECECVCKKKKQNKEI